MYSGALVCGHDSNIGSVLAAIDAEEYILPDTVERKTPIGSKLVFARWQGEDGEDYMSLDLVYQIPCQLREMELLDIENHPSVFPVTLKGLEKNSDGLYAEKDLMDRLREAADQYDKIVEEYK